MDVLALLKNDRKTVGGSRLERAADKAACKSR